MSLLFCEFVLQNIRRNLEMREETVAWLMQFSSNSDDDTFEVRAKDGFEMYIIGKKKEK